RLRPQKIWNDQRQRDRVLREPPRQSRGDAAQRIDGGADQRVPFARVDPAMKAPARFRGAEHGVESEARLDEVVQHADAVDEVDGAEVDFGEVTTAELDVCDGIRNKVERV